MNEWERSLPNLVWHQYKYEEISSFVSTIKSSRGEWKFHLKTSFEFVRLSHGNMFGWILTFCLFNSGLLLKFLQKIPKASLVWFLYWTPLDVSRFTHLNFIGIAGVRIVAVHSFHVPLEVTFCYGCLVAEIASEVASLEFKNTRTQLISHWRFGDDFGADRAFNFNVTSAMVIKQRASVLVDLVTNFAFGFFLLLHYSLMLL